MNKLFKTTIPMSRLKLNNRKNPLLALIPDMCKMLEAVANERHCAFGELYEKPENKQ